MRSLRGVRLIGLLCALAIVVISLVPNALRPHSGAPKGLEHFWAYALCGLMLTLGFRRRGHVLLIAALLVLGSAVLEVSQAWAIGRTPAISDFGFSSLGACIGLAAGLCADRLLRRSTSPLAEPIVASNPRPTDQQRR